MLKAERGSSELMGMFSQGLHRDDDEDVDAVEAGLSVVSITIGSPRVLACSSGVRTRV